MQEMSEREKSYYAEVVRICGWLGIEYSDLKVQTINNANNEVTGKLFVSWYTDWGHVPLPRVRVRDNQTKLLVRGLANLLPDGVENANS